LATDLVAKTWSICYTSVWPNIFLNSPIYLNPAKSK
jgi:hypothetical protein